jgi:hypothetical protein
LVTGASDFAVASAVVLSTWQRGLPRPLPETRSIFMFHQVLIAGDDGIFGEYTLDFMHSILSTFNPG